MSRDSTYAPPLTNAEIIQIAAARRAGDAILRKATGNPYAESALDVRDALRGAGVRTIGMGTEMGYTVIARFRVVPPWQRYSLCAQLPGRMVKPEPVSECFLMTGRGKMFLIVPGTDYVSYVTVPVGVLALIDDVFARNGAYKVDGGEFIKAAIARAVGHVVKQEQERELQADIAAQVGQMTFRQKLAIGAMMMSDPYSPQAIAFALDASEYAREQRGEAA